MYNVFKICFHFAKNDFHVPDYNYTRVYACAMHLHACVSVTNDNVGLHEIMSCP